MSGAADDLRAGRIVGLTLLVEMVLAPIYNFRLLDPVFAAPGFLANAALHADGMALGVVLMLVTALAGVASGVVAWAPFRRTAPTLALGYLAICIVCAVLLIVEGQHLLTLRSMSEAYTAAGGATGANVAVFEAMRTTVGQSRNWAHYTGLILSGVSVVLFYLTLYRTALVPRAFGALGMLAGALQLVSVTRPLWGITVDFLLLAPLGLVHLTLALWLLVRGFRAPAVAPASA
ncbi:MAG: DUF4386 domain-containing protein [Gemmatimonadetes bacterium]|nr:DUF4386 domain-containing protein [Gemmatimonadota bacterium]